jgi:hypothetical protein
VAAPDDFTRHLVGGRVHQHGKSVSGSPSVGVPAKLSGVEVVICGKTWEEMRSEIPATGNE